MIKHFCDRCGGEALRPSEVSIQGHVPNWELCFTCSQELLVWIKRAAAKPSAAVSERSQKE